jgi:superfamily II DNA or RNA helicase
VINLKDFLDIEFKGNFRIYQQRVLDNSIELLKDNKINIVAAPGSGKTILGLEIIRRLKNPCII